MSMVREREKTRRTIWIVAGFVLAIAIAASAYLFARRTDMPTAPANGDTSSTEGSTPTIGTPATSTQAAGGAALGSASGGQGGLAASPTSSPVSNPDGATSGSTQLATTSSTKAPADGDSAAAAAKTAPAMSDEEQSLAAEVGDTRRATAPGSGNTD